VRAGAQPYLGARIVSGDEMIDGVLSPRGFAAARSMEADPARCESWRREHCGSWPQRHRFDEGERAVVTSGGYVDEFRSRLVVGRGECVVAEFAQEVVGAPTEFARDRQAGAVVVDPFGDFQVVGVVG